jgi:hypothetical protein
VVAKALVDLGDAAVFGVAESAEQSNDIQAKLVMRQGVAALPLGAVGRRAVTVVGLHRVAAGGTVRVHRAKVLRLLGRVGALSWTREDSWRLCPKSYLSAKLPVQPTLPS